MNGKQDK
jgi:Ras-related protein Rab-11A